MEVEVRRSDVPGEVLCYSVFVRKVLEIACAEFGCRQIRMPDKIKSYKKRS